MAKAARSENEAAALYMKYLDEACEAKVSVKAGRSWHLAAYRCFRDMGEAIDWAQAQQRALMKKHRHVQLIVTNRTERQWRNAMRRPKTVKA